MYTIDQPEFRDQATIRPLFYVALSGEFLPPSDEEHRKHTLGRLLIATISKGSIDDWGRIRDENAPFSAKHMSFLHRYKPSWAPVESTAITATETKVTHDSKHHRTEVSSLTIVGLELRALESDAKLKVYDNTSSSDNWLGVRLIFVSPESEVTTMPLSLGEELNVARASVADSAQAFFDQI